MLRCRLLHDNHIDMDKEQHVSELPVILAHDVGSTMAGCMSANMVASCVSDPSLLVDSNRNPHMKPYGNYSLHFPGLK